MLKEISIHTPAWGVTIPLDDGINGVVNFNPHARVGRDTKYADEYHLLVHISIHTPAWGVTLPSVRFSPSYIYFNPHARVGRDFFGPVGHHFVAYFNPHARVGRDWLY